MIEINAGFSVWAPNAKHVKLVLAGETHPMATGESGWWRPDVSAGRGGVDYSFVLDGRELPDPRSPWQPAGVFGPSRTVDHGTFEWTDAGWRPPPLERAVFYELHVGTFSGAGTFAGVCGHLDHLKELGVTHINLMPVHQFSGQRGWGYDGVYLFAPHHAYGGPDELKKLVDACHRAGLAVFLDVVLNHLGPEGNFLDRFGPYFSGRYRLPWGRAMNFDGPGSDEVRRFVCDNARMWIRDYHLDGLRLDSAEAMLDTSALHILEELTRETKSLERELGRSICLVAEVYQNDPWYTRSANSGGCGFDAQWSDDFHHAVHALLTGERHGYYADFGSMAKVAKAFTRAFVLDGAYSVYRRRRHGRPAGDVSGKNFVVFLENHDQVGHRADGRRLSELMGLDRLKIAVALLLTSPCVPMLFQGEEWGGRSKFHFFTDFEDKKLAAKVRTGRNRGLRALGWRTRGIPDHDAFDTFEQCKVDWDALDSQKHGEILQWYQALIALRREMPEMGCATLGDVDVDYCEEKGWLRLDRAGVTVAVNLGDEAQCVPLVDGPVWTVKLASKDGCVVREGAIALPGHAVAILSAR